MSEVRHDNPDMARLLIDNKANVDYEMKAGDTALGIAVQLIDYDRMPNKPIPLRPAVQPPGVNAQVESANFRTDFLALPGADESSCYAYRLGGHVQMYRFCRSWLCSTKNYAEHTGRVG